MKTLITGLKSLSALTLIACCYSCNNNNNSNEIFTLDLAKNISSGVKEITFNDIFDIEKVIPIETTDSTLMSADAKIQLVQDNTIVLSYKNTVYTIDKNTNKAISTFNKSGKGHGEYLSILNIREDYDKNILLYDFRTNLVRKYDYRGNYIKEIDQNRSGIREYIDDSHYLIYKSIKNEDKYNLTIYDSNNKPLKQLFETDTTKHAMTFMDDLFTSNNNCYYMRTFGDTIYHITKDSANPAIVLNQGFLKMPHKIAASKAYFENDDNYITGFYSRFCGNYAFMQYYYNKKAFFDIWSISEGAPISRSLVDFTTRTGHPGSPLKINDATINVWPKFFDQDRVYCIVEAAEFKEAMPELTDEDNPVIIILKLK